MGMEAGLFPNLICPDNGVMAISKMHNWAKRNEAVLTVNTLKTNILVIILKAPFSLVSGDGKYVQFFSRKYADTEAKRCIFGGSNQ